MLPWKKHQDDGVGVGPSETKKVSDDGELDMLSAVADDLLAAIEKKDRSLLKEALGALVDHIQYLDYEQDKES